MCLHENVLIHYKTCGMIWNEPNGIEYTKNRMSHSFKSLFLMICFNLQVDYF